MTFWRIDLPDGGTVFGEAETSAGARAVIDGLARGSVELHGDRWRWAVDDHRGLADTRAEAWETVADVLYRPFRGTHLCAPRGLWVREP